MGEKVVVMKILVILGNYMPNSHANGICTDQVIRNLQKRGHEVHVLCYGNSINECKPEVLNDVYIHRIRRFQKYKMPSEYGRSFMSRFLPICKKWMVRLKLLLFLPVYPLNSLVLVSSFYRKANSLHKLEYYDALIAVCNPLEAVVSGALLKKKNRNIKSVMYVLDTLTCNPKKSFLSGWLNWSGWLWEKRLYKVYDLIINMNSYLDNYNNKRYDRFRNKIRFSDIPLLMDEWKPEVKKPTKKSSYKWLYTGKLDMHSRNPEYLCKLFLLDKTLNKHEIHFYSYGNCENMILRYSAKSSGRIHQHGYVSRDKIIEELNEADILVSIGNKDSKMVPSKIFEYISTGKKIIHFYQNENDSCLVYLKKYKNALLINEKEETSKNIQKIKHFIDRPSMVIANKDIDILYEANKPSYTANIIEELLISNSTRG